MDRVDGLAVAPNGDVIVSGRSSSRDLPGLEETPEGCRPAPVQELGFIARVAADGATAGPTQLITGAPSCTYLNCSVTSDYTNFVEPWPVAVSATGLAFTGGTNGTVAAVDFLQTNRLACVTDPADNVQLRTLAPGELVSLFGEDLAPALPLVPASGTQASTTNFGAFFDGVPAPILYSSGQQINVQVPFETAGKNSVKLQLVDKNVPLQLMESRTFQVADRQPAIFLAPAGFTSPFPGYTPCGGVVSIGPQALALNADGTVNDCTNPAAPGSTVTLFANGLGQVTPALATGTIAPAPAVDLTPGLALSAPGAAPSNVTTMTLPGALEGVEQVKVQLPPAAPATPAYDLVPTVLGVTLRERLVLIWVRAK